MTTQSQIITERACAKVNLSLQITGRRADGYHDLVSLVAFAIELTDTVTLTVGAEPGVTVIGPAASHLEGPNIVDKAIAAIARAAPELRLGHFTLEKRLPVAAGLGGGSADAAAALRAIAAANAIPNCEHRFAALAATLGADVPVCLGGGGTTGAMMSGIGEVVCRPVGQPLIPAHLYAVLVNPGRPVATREVFRRLDAPPSPDQDVRRPLALEPFATADDLIGFLAASRNDLEPVARAIEPLIDGVLTAIAAQAGCRLARMSGSGATCFGLFGERKAADAAASAISAAYPEWWVSTSVLT